MKLCTPEMCDVCVCGGGGPSDNRAASVPQERSLWKSKTEHRERRVLQGSLGKEGGDDCEESQLEPRAGAAVQSHVEKVSASTEERGVGIEALHSRRCRGPKRSTGKQGGASVWGAGVNRERRKAREKKPATAAPQRSPVTVWRETALSPVLSKPGCCCLRHPVLSDHPFNSPH